MVFSVAVPMASSAMHCLPVRNCYKDVVQRVSVMNRECFVRELATTTQSVCAVNAVRMENAVPSAIQVPVLPDNCAREAHVLPVVVQI